VADRLSADDASLTVTHTATGTATATATGTEAGSLDGTGYSCRWRWPMTTAG